MESPEVATQVCSLRFDDGTMVAAQIQASSPYEDVPVRYSGAVERIPIAFPVANAVLLRALFQSFAREVGAIFRENLIGNWKCSAGEGDDSVLEFSENTAALGGIQLVGPRGGRLAREVSGARASLRWE